MPEANSVPEKKGCSIRYSVQDTEQKTSTFITGIGISDTIQIFPNQIYQITTTMHTLPTQKESAQVTLPQINMKLMTMGMSGTRKPIYPRAS